MATQIDKALNRMPVGETPDGVEAEIEIEVILPGEDEVDDAAAEAEEFEFGGNLVTLLEDSEVTELATDLVAEIENDKRSRAEWEKTYKEGLNLLGLKYEERTEPWDGACGVFHPMITEAVVRFQAETITETFPASGPVLTKIIGKETPEKKDAAIRLKEDMNHLLTDEIPDYRSEHERMLFSLPSVGDAFKKIYPVDEKPVSIFVPAEDVFLPHGTTSLQACPRITHRMFKTEDDIKRLQVDGFYRDDIEVTQATIPNQSRDDIKEAKDKESGQRNLNDKRPELYETAAMLCIKGDPMANEHGLASPYIVTMVAGSNQVLSIRRNWREEDENRVARQHFVQYQYVPGFGAYGFGLFHLIGGYAKASTSLLRQLVDAGTLSNLPGGLKTKGLRIKGDDTPIAPGEFRDVDVGSGTIKDNIMPLPYKEPSMVLAGLLEKIVEEGRRFAATADLKVSDMSAQAPVGTTLALLERHLKVMTAVQARVHNSLKQEFKLIAEICRDYGPGEYLYQPSVGEPRAKKSDFALAEVIPVSDPNAATMSQRIVQYQAVIQMAQMAPEIYDLPQLHRGMLDVLGIKHADKLVPLPEDMKPMDPVSENSQILKSEPVKAFLYQNHEAHIAVHSMAAQDPLIMQLVGQNPKAPMIMAAMQAHIAEHVGFAYRQKIEAQLGMPLPPEDEKLPPEIELQLSGMMVEAAQRVLQQSQTVAAQQQAQQKAQDPVVQIQQQELQIKKEANAIRSKEADTKAKKIVLDAAVAADRLELDKALGEGKLQLEATQVGAEIESDKARMVADQSAEGVRLGVDISKHKAQMREQRRATAINAMQRAQTKKPSGDKK